jgi:hypothetical protein
VPYYHLSLNTDQPVAIKTRISSRGISKDSFGNESNSDGETAPVEAVTVDELQAMVQLLQIQVQNLGKNVEAIFLLYEKQRTKPETPPVASHARRLGFWKKLGMILGLGLSRQVL